MSFTRDPYKMPELTDAIVDHANITRQQLIHVICVGAGDALNSIMVTPFLPRVGDRIVLQGNKICEVIRVYFTALPHNDENGKVTAITLRPDVYAKLIEEEEEENEDGNS